MRGELGSQVRAWRLHAGLSQAEVERRAGLAHNALSRIETGEVAPRLTTLERVAEALGIGIEQLQFRTPPGETKRAGGPRSEDGIVRLIELLRDLPETRRQQVVDLLIRMTEQVR